MNDVAFVTNWQLTNWLIALPIQIDLSIRLQLGQPMPLILPNGLEILQTTVPTVKDHTRWTKPSLISGGYQRLKVVIFGQVVVLFIIQTVIAGNVSVAISHRVMRLIPDCLCLPDQ